jgi:hypothetical protein
MWWNLAEHCVQLVFMAAIIFGAQAYSRRAHSGRVRSEARRLRSVLAVSLPSLRKLYEDNLVILGGAELTLLSGRNQINLLRTQLSRLTSLDPAEIEAVMTASIAAERAETAMEVAGRKIGAVAFQIAAKDAARVTLRSALREACDLLVAAEQRLDPDASRLEIVAGVLLPREPEAETPRADSSDLMLPDATPVIPPRLAQATPNREEYPVSV